MPRVKVDLSKCTGCGLCQLACSAVKEKVYNPEKARIKVTKQGLPPQSAVLVCAQCRKAACKEICPGKAITRNNTTGALVIDDSRCVGCGLCVDACPLDTIWLHPETGVAMKCDLCSGEPACVARCPRGALSVFEGKSKLSESANRLVNHYLEQKGLSPADFLISAGG